MRAVTFGLALWAASAAAHDHHVTLAEVRHAPDQGVLQVVLDLDTADLQLELESRPGNAPVLESTAADSAIVALLEDHFVVRDAAGEARSMGWIGKEISAVESTLYFTVDVTDGVDGLTLEQTLGLAHHARQVNTVNVHARGTIQSLVYTREVRRHALVIAN